MDSGTQKQLGSCSRLHPAALEKHTGSQSEIAASTIKPPLFRSTNRIAIVDPIRSLDSKRVDEERCNYLEFPRQTNSMGGIPPVHHVVAAIVPNFWFAFFGSDVG